MAMTSSGVYDVIRAKYAMVKSARVSVLVLPGCRMSNAFGFGDVFSLAQLINERAFAGAQPRIHARRVSLSGRAVRASDGTLIPVEDAASPGTLGDALIVPGCAGQISKTDDLTRRYARAIGFLRALSRRTKLIIAAQCSSCFLLAEAGLLRDRQATTTWWAQPAFRSRYPDVRLVPHAMMTVDGNLVCVSGPCSYPLLAVHLLERLASPGLASLCAKYAEIDRSLDSQLPFSGGGLEYGDNPLAYRARQLVLEALPDGISVPELARRLSMTVRTLQRRLTAMTSLAPKAFIDHVRHERVKELLETTEESMDSILAKVGFSDESSFRRSFRRHVHMTPAQYRRTYGPATAADWQSV